jgi:hypothetical protein
MKDAQIRIQNVRDSSRVHAEYTKPASRIAREAKCASLRMDLLILNTEKHPATRLFAEWHTRPDASPNFNRALLE